MLKNGLTSILPKPTSNTTNNVKTRVGKVYGIVLDEASPGFDLAGGYAGIGSIFYITYDESKNLDFVDLSVCQIARPLNANIRAYPLIGELVVLATLPTISSQVKESTYETYYISTINIWNNIHHNAVPGTNEFTLGRTFVENSNINALRVYEGDILHESRFGSAIRLGSTNAGEKNYWSSGGKSGSPITIISNGHKFDTKSTIPHVEDINSVGANILLTSDQVIPLNTNKIKLNALNNTISANKYNDTQILLSANRLVLCAKNDEVLILGNSTIEINTSATLNLNGDERVHVSGGRIFLGTRKNGKLPDEPLLLGDKTVNLLDRMLREMINFASILSSAVSTPQGSPLLEINAAAQLMSTKLESLLNETESLKSKQNYTI